MKKKKKSNAMKYYAIIAISGVLLGMGIIVACLSLQGGKIDIIEESNIVNNTTASLEQTSSTVAIPETSVDMTSSAEPGSEATATEYIPEITEAPTTTEEITTEEPTTEYVAPTTECLPEMQSNMIVPGDAPARLNEYYFLVNNAAYDVFYYANSSADQYIDKINACAEALNGKAQVYTLMVPNASGVILSPEQQAAIGGYNMANAMAYFSSRLAPQVRYVDIYSNLLAHNREYIFFRTDHHWTQLGAYYAYRAFTDVLGERPLELNEFTRVEYPGFLGSIYYNTGSPAAIGNTPDSVIGYIPPEVNTIRYMHADGQWFTTNLINDMSQGAPSSKYFVFGAGDQPFEVIDNPLQTNGRSCVIFKDSYGNPFVPFLAHHYQTVYIVDPRYYSDLHLYAFVEQNGVNDVLFLNSVEFLNQSFANQIAANFN